MTIKVLRIKELGLKTKNLSSALSTFMLSASSAVNTVGKGYIICSIILLFPIHIFVAINTPTKISPIDIKNIIPDTKSINSLPHTYSKIHSSS
ncbi:hypothetical protein ACIXHQ_12765 [Bacteroides fragilis]